jgi:hypothetical protein
VEAFKDESSRPESKMTVRTEDNKSVFKTSLQEEQGEKVNSFNIL